MSTFFKFPRILMVLIIALTSLCNSSFVYADDDIDNDDLSGVIASVASEHQFTVEGITVRTSANTDYEHGTIDDLMIGEFVKVEGNVDVTGLILATEVTFQKNESKKIKGVIEGIVSSSEFVVNGQYIFVTTDTEYKKGNLSDLALGRYLEVEGRRNIINRVRADEIKFKSKLDIAVVGYNVGGGGVKGPMAQALVTAYSFDGSLDPFLKPINSGFQNFIVGTGTTNISAQITGLILPSNPPYILEFTGVNPTIPTNPLTGTYDITTGQYPVIDVLRTVVTQQMINSGADLYATPLTTMAADLAILIASQDPIANVDSVISAAEFASAVDTATSMIVSTLGFGIDKSINVFTTPPLLDSSALNVLQQQNVTEYRMAVEALTAITYEMLQLAGDTAFTTNDVLASLTADLADGVIDGMASGVLVDAYPVASLDVLAQDPSTLPIPNVIPAQTVSDVKSIVITETVDTGNTAVNTILFQADSSPIVVKPAETSPDLDSDGVLNTADAFPTDPTESVDTDLDGIGNNADTDDDNDGVLDASDNFPLDTTEWIDTDLDGIGNNADTDDDNDGVLDAVDDFPLDPTRQLAIDQDGDGWPVGQDPDDNPLTGSAIPTFLYVDTDGDGLADTGGLAQDTDDDNDGVLDVNDVFPLDVTESRDLDLDGIGDNSDSDIDGDAVLNTVDAFPYDYTESIDTDGDGIGNNIDDDDDNDGLTDYVEIALTTDPLDFDTDNDGALDGFDALPLNPLERFDSDNDGIGNNSDNCGLTSNPSQTDTDVDGFGDVCDLDIDGDGVNNVADSFPLDLTEWSDLDGDGTGDNTDLDIDGDGVDNTIDVFPLDLTEWIDTDGDGIGNNADPDDDGDGVLDINDAFPLDPTLSVITDVDGDGWPVGQDTDDNNNLVPTIAYIDTDGDGLADNGGLAPDTDDDNDGVADLIDAFPLDATESSDLDGDLIGDNSDPDIDGDGVLNVNDAFPYDPTETIDTDGDGIGNNTDLDDDNDGTNDLQDVFPLNPNEWNDLDSDGIGDNSDPDIDGDGVFNASDVFPLDASETLDTDGDGVGNNSDDFPFDPSETLDTDLDGVGNNTDLDDDNDGLSDIDELTLGTDPLNNDTDGDGAIDSVDVFPLDPTEQFDRDGDGVGDNADLMPNDPTIGAAQPFTAVDLSSSYKRLTVGALPDPPRILGEISGERYDFDGAGQGYRAGRFEGHSYSYNLSSDELIITPDSSKKFYDFSYDFVPSAGMDWTIARLFGRIEGVVDPSDPTGDTIIITRFVSATLSRNGQPDYEYGTVWPENFSSLDTNVVGMSRMSFSGQNNDYRACPNGFTAPVVNPTDCSFAADGAGGFGWTKSFAPDLWVSAADGLPGELCVANGCRVSNQLYGVEASNAINGWSLIEVTPTNSNYRVANYAKFGMLSQQVVDNFITNYGNQRIEASEEVISEKWQLIENGPIQDRFLVTKTTSYNFNNALQREQLLGNINAGPLSVVSMPEELILTEESSLPIIPFTVAELTSSQWGMMVNFDPRNTYNWGRLTSDLVSFNADFTGTGQYVSAPFTWSIDVNGILNIIYANGNTVRIQKFEAYTAGFGLLIEAMAEGQHFASYEMSVSSDNTTTINSLTNQFLQNSFSLTDTDAYDQNGNFYDAVWPNLGF